MPDLARSDLWELCGASTVGLTSANSMFDARNGQPAVDCLLKAAIIAGQHENRFHCHTLPRI
jgi:hypothetical protein